MSELTPISIIIDDAAPLIHVYKEHCVIYKNYLSTPVTKDGRLLVDEIPNSFLDKFCDSVEHWGIRGKFSVVPAPGCRGDIVNGITGHDMKDVRYWIETVNKRLAPNFDFCPEMLTHHYALDLTTGEYINTDEETWSFKQYRSTLTPYISHALELLKQAGIDATGVTSPWSFGIEVEDEYIAAIAAAQDAVFGRKISWYLLHAMTDKPGAKPWIAYNQSGYKLVSIPGTINDYFWQTIDCADTSPEYISSVAENLISEDGAKGSIIDVLSTGGWPIIITHWQSLFSNGLETGLKALNIVGKRVQKYLNQKVEWKNCMEMTNIILNGEN
ncbi:MAG: hypothetical protein FWD71_20670 [Oscillospiraceae bacterium]|nr:hypothetical protein [Oscillospiraceae bacterium]